MCFFLFSGLWCLFAYVFALLRYASRDLLFGGVMVREAGDFWGEILAMSVNSVNGVMWEISEIEGLILAMDWVRVRVIAIFFKHFDQECIFSLKYGFCKIFIKDIETFLFRIALFTYISARFNQNCMKTLENEQNEDVREAFLSTLSPFDRFQREVADLLIDVLEITNGDAQGICEAEDDLLSDCFRKEMSVRETAELIANQ